MLASFHNANMYCLRLMVRKNVNIFLKAWHCWLYKYSSAVEEKHKIQYAVQIYNRKLAFKVLHSFKLYRMQRDLKKLRLCK